MFLCRVPTLRATLARVRRINGYHLHWRSGVSGFVGQALPEERPRLRADGSVETGFLTDVLPRSLDRALGRANHVLNL
jgi:hypothetical protein